MYAITGITGQVGGILARTLRDDGADVRAIVRDPAKGKTWQQRGCDVAIADVAETASLQRAFSDVQGAFILLPPIFDPAPGFPECTAIIESMKQALVAARPPKVVVLSTIGAHAARPNLLNQLGMLERALRDLPVPVTFLRAAWFMENALWDVEPAKSTGIIPSFLQPLDKPVPMVATADVGHVAAELLLETWQGIRVIELEGPQRVTPAEVAATFAKVLCRDVRMEAVPRSEWEALFRNQGMKYPISRMQMLDGFNEGWIEFSQSQEKTRKGVVSLETAIQGVIERISQ